MIDVISPVNTAYERMKKILFPFVLERWIPIAFGAFLMSPVLGGFANGYSNSSQNDNHDQSLNIGLLIFFTIVGLFGLAFSIFIMWLNARGRFMFLDNILNEKPSISEPWKKYSFQANQLFFFNILLAIATFLYLILGFIPFVVIAFLKPSAVILYVIYGLFFCVVSIPIFVVLFAFTSFGVPIMYKQGISPWAAFQITTSLIGKDPIGILLCMLAMFIMGVTYGAAVLVLGTCTLLIFCCAFGTPFLGNLVVLPVTVFFQCYTLEVLAQFGPEYDLWNQATEVTRD